MSNALINYHVTHERPCGDTSLENLAEYYGELLFSLDELLKSWEDTDHYDDLYLKATYDCMNELYSALHPDTEEEG